MNSRKSKAPVCFVISPIGDAGSEIRKHADWVLDGLIRPALEGIIERDDVIRADEEVSSGIISDLMIKRIIESDLAIADLSGLNANVFYEIGIRHAVRKSIVHLASIGTKLPFDNSNQSTIFFDLLDIKSVNNCKKSIRDAAILSLSDGHIPSNPYVSALNSLQMSLSPEPKDRIINELMNRIERMDRSMSEIKNNQVVLSAFSNYVIPPSRQVGALSSLGKLSISELGTTNTFEDRPDNFHNQFEPLGKSTYYRK